MNGATFGRVLTETGDFVVEAMDNGSTIERVTLRNGAEFDVDTNRVFDSQIHTIEQLDGDTPTFNERTLTDESNRGEVRFDFDTRFNEPPTLSFGQRGGGIEKVTFARTSEDGQYYAADISLAEPGGTIDVRTQLRGQL